MQQQEQQILEMIKRVAEDPKNASKEDLLSLLAVLFNLSEGVQMTRALHLIATDAFKVLSAAISVSREPSVEVVTE